MAKFIIEAELDKYLAKLDLTIILNYKGMLIFNLIKELSLKALQIALLLLFLTSCATKVSSLKEDKDIQLNAESGYLLLGIETNRSIKSIHINGPQNIIITHEDLKAGTNFVFTNLPVGKYTITKIKLDHYWRVRLDEEELWEFELSPQSVNYVGHLELKQAIYWFLGGTTELVNRSSEALEFLEKDYPNILANRELFYGGPGEDNFFALLRDLEGKGNE